MIYIVRQFGEEERLYISKGPSLKSWGVLLCFFLLGICIALCFPDSIITQLLCLLLCLMVGLSCIGEWEDCVLDQCKDRVTFIRNNWCDRLLGRAAERNTRRLQLSNITAVQTTNQGILLMLKSSNLIQFPVTPLNKRDRDMLNQHIASYLRLNHLEEINSDYTVGYEDWFDLNHAETSSESEVAAEENPRTPRLREQIKILSEPAPPS